LSLGNSFDLKWDAWNRLIEVKNTGGSVVATYGYDGAHRRVTKDNGTNVRHYYYSDRWQILEERLDSASTADKRFVWGARAVDDLVARNHGTTRHYALSDALGSVTAIVNTSGTVRERYGYDGFGQPRYMNASFGSRSSSSYTWETLFDAYRYDTESGLYQVRYRYLHPRLGRWVSRDPFEEEGTNNLYEFVENSPNNRADPNGLLVVCRTTSRRLYTKRFRQDSPEYETPRFIVSKYEQHTVGVPVVGRGGIIVPTVPTHYTCTCVCYTRRAVRRRNVKCTKYRETTICTGPCNVRNPIEFTEDFWGPPEYGKAKEVPMGPGSNRFVIDASGPGKLTYWECQLKCDRICSKGFGDPPDFEEATCSD
jgi:RHS repeat-associated protein